MKRNFVKIIGGAVSAFLVISALAFGLVFAQEDESKNENRDGGKLEGTWEEQVTIRNCQTGTAIRTFASTTTFISGGTLLDSTSGIAQALKTPGHGVWKHTEGNIYQFKFKVFNFDASGNSTGWQIVMHEATVNHRADAFESAGTSEIYSPTGVLLFTGCSTTTAVRFEL